MKSCWELLQITPTNDVEVIKRARRLLIRKWHPDLVASAEEKRNHTARCAEINAAYEQAVRFAKVWNRGVSAPVPKANRTVHTGAHLLVLILTVAATALLIIGFRFLISVFFTDAGSMFGGEICFILNFVSCGMGTGNKGIAQTVGLLGVTII
jgi:preprotein translocase subunit Sec63